MYYGERIPDYSVVGTTAAGARAGGRGVRGRRPSPATRARAACSLDSFPRRLAFGLRFGDTNLVISNFITDQSRILFQRDVRERAVAVAPFLTFDSNPYPAVVDDRMVYILDAYTTSDYVPELAVLPRARPPAPASCRPPGRSTTCATRSRRSSTPTTAPSRSTWSTRPTRSSRRTSRRSPSCSPTSVEMSQDLVSHLRYPEDLFRVQTDMWGRYHIEDSKDFYDRTDAWEPPPAPPDAPPTDGASRRRRSPSRCRPGPGGSTTGVTTKPARMAPSYVINQLPDEEETSFKIMRTYQPYSDDDSKQLLTAFMAGGSDGDDLGKLTLYVPKPAEGSEGAQIDGPGIVERHDPQRRRWCRARSPCSTPRARRSPSASC